MAFEECPYVISGEAEVDHINSPVPDEDAAPDLVSTGVDASLNAQGCDAFLRARKATLVAVVAGPNAGKTTLLSTIYELALRRKLKGFGFGGSETIRGFEERCFLSRANSGRSKANTQHTPTRAGLNFTHLSLHSSEGLEDLLFSDRSGEFFQRVQNTPDLLAEFSEFERADVIILVLDGELLATSAHKAISESRKLLLALARNNQFPAKPLKIVISKSDLIRDESTTAVKAIVTEFQDECIRRIPGISVSIHYTAARPLAGDTEFGQGMAELTAELLKKPAAPRYSTRVAVPRNGSSLDLLLMRCGER